MITLSDCAAACASDSVCVSHSVCVSGSAGSSPSSIVWVASTDSGSGDSTGGGQLQAGGKRFCLNGGEGSPVAPCGLDKALPAQIKLEECANKSATGGWTRVIVK